MRGTTCCEQDASLAIIWRALRFGCIVANADVVTTTYSYDSNGNLTSGAGWGYTWDYLNRMLSSGFGNSTTTYAYDATGARVLQTSTTSTTFYPNKFYSFASTLIGSTTYATSTNYVWNGDTLLATIDQPMINGSATGTPITRYVHPDHLGSTNAVTDQNGALVQLLDYYPYGATRISTPTYPTNENRQYIGQYYDTGSSLIYDNARYYNPAHGQFLSEDPTFLAIGNPLQVQQLSQRQQTLLLADPQLLNSYAYARNNPVKYKDANGNIAFVPLVLLIVGAYNLAMTGIDAYDAYNTDIAYHNGTTFQDKELSTSQVGYDYVQSKAGSLAAKFGMKEVSPAIGVMQAGVDVITKWPEVVNYYGNGGFRSDVASTYSSVAGLSNWAVASLNTFGAGSYNFFSRFINSNGNTNRSGASKSTASSPPNSGGGSGSQPLPYLASQLGVGNSGTGGFYGTYNFGPGVGTFNFGTGQWQK